MSRAAETLPPSTTQCTRRQHWLGPSAFHAEVCVRVCPGAGVRHVQVAIQAARAPRALTTPAAAPATGPSKQPGPGAPPPALLQPLRPAMAACSRQLTPMLSELRFMHQKYAMNPPPCSALAPDPQMILCLSLRQSASLQIANRESSATNFQDLCAATVAEVHDVS